MQVRELAPRSVQLLFRGFPREVQPPQPALLEYRWQEFQPLASFKVMPGAYTKHGDVTPLLRQRDNQMAIFGPGDGLSVRFAAEGLGPVKPGFKRTFLLQTVGYCKDMDLYTGKGEAVEPLPFLGMTDYPYSSAEQPADAAAWREYQKAWNTRIVEGTFFDGFDGATQSAERAMGMTFRSALRVQ